MPSRLLGLEPDKLFEERSVAEVEEILKSVEAESERKKEELRTLVGERYRDLIEAADSIRVMKELSSEVIIRDVGEINTRMVALQKRLQKSTNFKHDSTLKEKTISPSDTVAAQISVLVELPELIWTAVSDRDYLRATHLHLLGRHIKIGFSVDKTLKEAAGNLPLLENLWTTISSFSHIIVQNMENDLKEKDLSPQVASVCLASLTLLQNVSIVDKFLDLRSESLANILSITRDDLKDISFVKNKLLDSCLCVVNTLRLLNSCFLEPWDLGQGMVKRQLHLVATNSQKPVQMLGENISSSFLPSIVDHFKVSPLTDLNSIDLKQIEVKVYSWLETMKTTILDKGALLLKKVNSISTLNSLKGGFTRSEHEWDNLLKTFNVEKTFDLWKEVYDPLCTERAKQLITSHCEDALKEITSQIKENFNSGDEERTDVDLRWFIWKESPDDLYAQDESFRRMLLKSKGLTPKVSSICSVFESKLSLLYKDLSGLYNAGDMLVSEEDKLRQHQQSAISNIVIKLKEATREMLSGDTNLREGDLCIFSRLLQSIPELCPTLQKLLTLGGDSKGTAWHELCLILNSESLFCWSLWESKVHLKFEKALKETLKKPKSFSDLLNVTPEWDLCHLEKIDEDESPTHRSQIRVPSGPSLHLQCALHFVITNLRRAHLPRLINENMMQKLVPTILELYDCSGFLCQAEALQTLFDIKYLSTLYIPTTNKKLSEDIQQKLDQIEKSIDPIDLEVYSPLIRDKVRKYSARTAGTMGLSFGADNGGKVPIRVEEDDEDDDKLRPSVLPLSKASTSVWFPSLPISNPSSRPLHIVKPKAIRMGTSLTMSDSNPAKPSSSSFISYWFS